MGLQDRLDTIREGSKTRVPPETRAVMQRNIEELRASGIMDRVARVGHGPDGGDPPRAGRLLTGKERA
jgi:hypothetical protein